MLKVSMPALDRGAELELARRMTVGDAPERRLETGGVDAVLSPGELERARSALGDIEFRPELLGYVVDLVRSTRETESILVGAGPRATQALLAAARASAALSMRDFVTPDDIKTMAVPVLEHRLIVRPEFEIEGVTQREAINKILESVAVPL